MSPEQITLAQWCDYTAYFKKFSESNDINFLIEGLLCILQDEDRLRDIPLGTPEDVIANDILSFWSLVNHFDALIINYVPEKLEAPYHFKWQGEDFYLTESDTALILGVEPLTVGSAVTLLELQRRSNLDESNPLLFDVIYSLSLEHIAVLLRKKDEKLPLLISDRARFIDQRKVFFKDVPMTVGREIMLYFNAIIDSIFQMFPSTGNSSKEAKEHFDRVGWNSLLSKAPTALNLDYKDAFYAPIESAMYAITYD